MVNAFHVGHVDEILAGSGAQKDTIHNFLRNAHLESQANGCSWAAIGILTTGAVWIIAGQSKEELIEALEDVGAQEAELLELTTLN